jgi:ParB family chromosome partitioning protein
MANDRIRSIPVDLIDPDPAQPRRTFPEEELRGLGQTLAQGQIDPIHVRTIDSRFQIIHGERRWRAAKLMGLQTIAAIVIDSPPDEFTILEAQLISNIQREALNPIDQAYAIDRLIKCTGTTAASVAARLGKSPAQVSKLLSLLLLPQGVQSQIATGKLAAATGYEIAKVADPAIRDEMTSKALKGELTRDAAAAQNKSLTKTAKSRKVVQRQQRAVFRWDAGPSVTVCGRELNLSLLVNRIGDLLAALTRAQADGMDITQVAKSLSTGGTAP